MLAETESVYMLVVREQALIAQLFDVGIADNNEDADVAFFKCVVFHNEDAITAVEGPLRATAFLSLKVIKTMTFLFHKNFLVRFQAKASCFLSNNMICYY